MAIQAGVIEKIKIEGTLFLQSPLLIGSGTESSGRQHEVDTYVLKNEREIPFIPGTSLAGVLREYLSRRYLDQPDMTDYLFGRIIPKSDGSKDIQSAIVLNDIVLKETDLILRDGVAIDGYTNTAIKGCKYDYEAIERGAWGDFYMEVTLRKMHEACKAEIEEAIEALLVHMQQGFMLGALTAKGFGRVCVKRLKMKRYDFSQLDDVAAWFTGAELETVPDYTAKKEEIPEDFVVDADFALRSSLIIRDYNTDEQTAKGETLSAVQKMSDGSYVIPGTSIKGVLRHQAEKILRRLGKDATMLDDVMGYAKEQAKHKSRLFVDEVYIKKDNKVIAQEQSRNRIDRFTGGTIESALFTTKPIWQKHGEDKTIENFHYEIHGCNKWEAGLALFLLRDLWLGNVAIGGEKSIGRGTLKGLGARIRYKGQSYELDADGKVCSGDAAALEDMAQSLVSLGKEGEAK